MTSAIVPANVDGTYPIAGQDNDSQGFRDNFTNIKNNFTSAADEITDLQNKVILKSALSGTASVNNNMGGVVLSSAKLQDTRLTFVDAGTTNGTVTVNYGLGHYHSITTDGSVTLDFGSSFPGSALASAAFLVVRFKVTNVAHTLTFPAAVGNGDSAKSIQGIQGISGQTITFAEIGTYEFHFYTTDGGTTIFVNELTRPRSTFTDPLSIIDTTGAGNSTTGSLKVSGGAGIAGNVAVGGVVLLDSTQELSGNGTVNVAVSSTIFTTSANTAVSLGSGIEGQIKMLIANDVSSGNVTCTLDTVGESGWGGSAEILLSDQGAACTLVYTNSKWFAVGNNGATFS